MDLSRGCILLARSIDKSDVFQNEKWLKVWIWCMIQANHKGKSVPVKTGKYETVVKLERGQFIFGRNKAAEILNMKPSTVRNIMARLEKLENLDINKDTHFSIVTIRDYDFYQKFENYKGQATGQPEDRQRTGKGQAKDTTITPKHYNTPENGNKTTELFSKAFEKWWFTYPKRNGRRIGKKDAKKKFMSINQNQWNDLKTATENYCDYLDTSGLSACDAKRFLNETWKEYIEIAEHGSKSDDDKEFDEQFKHMMT